MTSKKRYFFLALFLITFLISCSPDEARMPSLKETYGKEDKKPFGGFVAFQQLVSAFPDNYVQSTYESFENTWKDNDLSTSDGKRSLYVLVTKDLFIGNTDIEAVVNYLKAGNDMFISADYIDPYLLREIECNTERQSEVSSELQGVMKVTEARMSTPAATSLEHFRYYYYPFQNYFSGFDNSTTRVLGWNENGRPNYIVRFIGKGRMYLHLAPRTFSNFFLLTKNNYLYLQELLGYMTVEPKNIFWDEFYKYEKYSSRKQAASPDGYGSGSNAGRNRENDSKFSSFNVINKHQELQWAFWLGLILLLLFALFNMKRKQRLIPKKEENINTTVAFTETVGRLYLQKKNNKNISEKMITYLLDHIRKNYFISTTKLDHDFMVKVAAKSGADLESIEVLFSTINTLQASEEVEDFQLLSLNEQVQNFYKIKH